MSFISVKEASEKWGDHGKSRTAVLRGWACPRCFHFHEAPNPACPVGRNIHGLLDGKLTSIQSAMENEMKKYTIADIHTGMQELLALEK